MAYVIDCGHHLFKLGSSGESNPAVLIPPQYATANTATVVGEPQLNDLSPDNVIHSSAYSNPEAELALWQHGLGLLEGSATDDKSKLKSLVVAENKGEESKRAGRAEWAFEKLNSERLFFGKTGALACFATARTKGLVVDFGHTDVRASAVQDGWVTSHKTSDIGGVALYRQTKEALSKQNVEVVPPYTFTKTKDVVTKVDVQDHVSYREYVLSKIINDLRWNLCQVKTATETDTTVEESYTLPDGTVVDGAEIRYSINEYMFAPVDKNVTSLPELIMSCATSAGTAETRKDLLSSIVVCGGGASVPGLTTRTLAQLKQRKGVHPHIVLTAEEHRPHLSWIGGSILGSLSTFDQFYVTASSYKEHGVGILNKMCP